MGCGSCGRKSNVEYEVKFSDGTTTRVSSTQEAIQLMRGKPGASYKAVAKVSA